MVRLLAISLRSAGFDGPKTRMMPNDMRMFAASTIVWGWGRQGEEGWWGAVW